MDRVPPLILKIEPGGCDRDGAGSGVDRADADVASRDDGDVPPLSVAMLPSAATLPA